MPNAKQGTLVPLDLIPKVISDMKKGSFMYKVDMHKNIHCKIGDSSYTDEDLLDNWKFFMSEISESRPESVKGRFITGAFLTSTLGPSFRVNAKQIDPASLINLLK